MKKKSVIVITILLSFLLFGTSIQAECINISVDGSNGGQTGGQSMSCGGNNCANTIGLKVNGHTFNNTSIYGLRLTIVVDGKEKEVKNFWATEKMKNSVNSNKVTRLGKTAKSYGNYYVNGNLYNYTNSKGYNLHQIDFARSATYAQFVGDKTNGLGNEQRLDKYLSKFSKKYSSVEKLASIDNVKIKVEPIYVLHHYGRSVGDYYYAGTSKEILKKRSSHNLSAVTSLSGWEVIKNYLKTIYTSKPSGDTNNDWYDKAGSSTGIGYIVFDQNSCAYSNLKIIKKQSNKKASENASRAGDSFVGCSNFAIMQKQSDGNFKNVTKSITGSNAIKIGKGCSGGSFDYKNIDKFPKGTYKIKETASNGIVVNSVYSKTDVDGSTKNRAGKESNEFKIAGGKKTNVTVTFVNQIKDNTDNEYTIAVSVRQLKYTDNWQLNYDLLKENDFYFEKEFDVNKKVCKTSESDDSTSRYQCYKLCSRNGLNCSDHSDKINLIDNYKGTVTLALEKYNGSTWKEVTGSRKTVDFDGSFNTVYWQVESKGTYRVKQTACKNCGDGKTYIKTQSYKNSSGTEMKGNFRRKLESVAFYVGSYKCGSKTCYTGRSKDGSEYFKENGKYYNVWIINQIPSCEVGQCCSADLEVIKNTNYNNVNDLKVDLINLHQTYNSEDNLLNFAPNDTDINSIKQKVSCSAPSKNAIDTSCDHSTIGFKQNKNEVPLSWYANSNLASDIYEKDDNVYCYINYDIDFKSDKVIKDNMNFYTKSFIWQNPLSDEVGKITGTLHCEGVVSDDNRNAYDKNMEDKIMNFIKKIKLIDEDGDLVQSLKLKKELTKEDYNVKINNDSSADLEGAEIFDDSSVSDGNDIDDGGFNVVDSSENTDLDDYTNNDKDDNTDIAENIIVGNYISLTQSFTYNLVYDKDYYADYFSGAASEMSSSTSLYRLGWGVPVNLNRLDGSIKFKYIFNNDSSIINFYKNTFSGIDDGISSSCRYKRKSSANLVRFIDTNNPFPGKNAQSRKTGKNWNTCYNAILNRIGQTSDMSYCDYTEKCSDQEHGSEIDKYCLYGDPDCDGRFNNYASSYTNSVSKILADVNKDGIIDRFDSMLVTNWYKYAMNGENIDLATVCSNYDIEYKKQYGNDEDTLISNYIKNEKNSSYDNPMYSFTLSSKDLQNIRKKMKDSETGRDKSYLDIDNLTCNNQGVCISNFITDLVTNSNGLSITNKSGTCFDTSHLVKVTEPSSDGKETVTFSRKICYK